MNIFDMISEYQPQSEQESVDQRVMLDYIALEGDRVLTRECQLAHITSSGFIVNPPRNKALLAHHNILNTWAWTGGHADGEGNLLAVALREAREETGVVEIDPCSPQIASVDILPVPSHIKRGRYVPAHLHLSVAYLLVCSEDQPLRPKADENTAVGWHPFSFFTTANLSPHDVALYTKLIDRAVSLEQCQ